MNFGATCKIGQQPIQLVVCLKNPWLIQFSCIFLKFLHQVDRNVGNIYFLWYSSTLSTYRALFFRGSLRNFSFLVILVVPLVAYTFSFSSIQHQMVIYDIYARLIFHQFGPNCDHGVALQLQVCSEVFSPFSDDCPNQKTKNTTFPKKDPSI